MSSALLLDIALLFNCQLKEVYGNTSQNCSSMSSLILSLLCLMVVSSICAALRRGARSHTIRVEIISLAAGTTNFSLTLNASLLL